MRTDNNGMNVIDELPLNEFLNYENENGNRLYDECVHIFPNHEKRTLEIYRKVNEGYPNERIKTTFENVRLINQMTKNDPKSLCFQGGDGENILTFLTALKSERSEYKLQMTYMETNNSQMIDESMFDNETVILEYETETDRTNFLKLDNIYKNTVQMFANY